MRRQAVVGLHFESSILRSADPRSIKSGARKHALQLECISPIEYEVHMQYWNLVFITRPVLALMQLLHEVLQMVSSPLCHT